MTIEQRQHLLAYLGYYTLAVDGIWGRNSQAATEAFQRRFGLTPDGVCGAETEKALTHAVCYGMPEYDEPETTDSFWDEIEYFTRDEFRCTCRGRYCNGFPVEPDEKIVRVVNEIRRHFGRPFSPNSAIRCPQRNADPDVGGASNSQHLYGTAVDISVPGVSPMDAAKFAETLLPDTGGIGIYPWGIHVDSRQTKARWYG